MVRRSKSVVASYFFDLSNKPYANWLFFLLGWFLVIIFLPGVAVAVLLVNLLAMVLVMTLQFYSASLPVKQVSTVHRSDKPFVSIHVPTYNEPPELVCKTLNALVDLDYENYEVIVLDNNTKERRIWLPVQKHCGKLGKRFRFEHVDNLQGFKAGALNVCLEKSSPETEYILVIDADYKVHPNLLNISLSYFSSDMIALVQFPQSYSNAHERNSGLSDEYEHFFQVYMNMANCLNCVLSTGTVSVINKKALTQVGKWSDRTITEDVDLGLRLHEAGYQGVYVPIPLGKGLMPTDLKSLRQQRERWVYGNAQTLFNFMKMSKKNISAWQFLGIFTQLTAWINFSVIPVISLGLLAIAILIQPQTAHMSMVMIAIATVWSFLVLKIAFFTLAFSNKNKTYKQAFYAYLVHLGLIWEGGGSWLRYMIRDNLGFKRTNKYKVAGPLKDLFPGIALSFTLAFCGILFLLGSHTLPAILSLILAPVFLSVFYVYKQTQNTYEFNYGNEEVKSKYNHSDV